MAAEGSYNPATKVLTVTGNGLPTPVTNGTFPNANNANTISAYTFNHAFTYRGGENTSNSGSFSVGIVGIAANGVAIFNPSGGTSGSPPQGFTYVAAGPNQSISRGEDNCGGRPEQSGQYSYRDSDLLDCWNSNQAIAGYNDYYGTSQFNGDNTRHPDGHSKIIGFCFDGYPVYGPYGYTDPNDNTTTPVRMESGYAVRAEASPGRPAYGAQYPAGVFMEDWEYIGGTGKLDVHNGRYCVTPEFPSGTWAYFLTEDTNGDPVFPFMVGSTSKEAQVIPDNNGFVAIVEDTGGGDSGGGSDDPLSLVIGSQPTNATVTSGNTQQFNVAATIEPENGTINYQWQVSTDGGFAWSNITGANESQLTITALSFMTGYRYRVILTGPVGGAQQAVNSPLSSNLAILTVTGSGTTIDYSSILKFDNTIGKYDMTPVEFDRDNNNPGFTTTNVFFDNTSENFDMT